MDYELYDLAFSYKKTKLWKKLWDSELFAVEHSDGSIGYCCVMGRAGAHLALAVYPGHEGLESYRMMSSASRPDILPFEMKEVALSQDCLMLSFQNKAELLPEEKETLTAYCAKRGVKLSGQRACPQFERFRPMHHPWFLDDEKDILHMKEALQAALEVSRQLETQNTEALGFEEGRPYDRDIPLLVMEKKNYVWRFQPLPPPLLKTYPSIDMKDDLMLARLKKVKKKAGEWAAQVFLNEEAVTEEEKEETQKGRSAKRPKKAPVFPWLLMVIDTQSTLVLNAQMSPDIEGYAQEFTQGLVDLILKNGKPQRLLVRDERSHALLQKLCPQLSIPLEKKTSIEALEEALMDFHEGFIGNDEMDEDGRGLSAQMQQLLESLENLDSLEGLPDEALTALLDMLPAGLFSRRLASMLKAEARSRKMI